MPGRYLCALLVALLLAPTVLAQRATDEARAHLQRNAFRYSLAPEDLADLAVTDAYTSRRSGTIHVYLRQRAEGIEIAQANFTVAVSPEGRVFHAAGRGAALAGQRLSTSPSVGAEAAATALARDAGLAVSEPFRVLSSEGERAPRLVLSGGGVAQEPVAAGLVYHLGDDERLALAWEVGLYEIGSDHYWLGYVDAASGRVLERHDLVVHDHFGPAAGSPEAAPSYAPLAEEPSFAPFAVVGAYRVFPVPMDSPYDATPPPPGDGRLLVANPDDGDASPFGWHDTNGAAGAEYTRTRGNNVHAYTDTNDDDSPDAGGDPDGGASLVFDFPANFTQPPSTYRPAAVTNLFYWNNVIHDVLWRYGFDEAAGNFQVNNYGNGGLGSDDVRAEAQDGGGTNNANFFTPVDGQRPRMQMYIGTDPNPDVDGDFDNGVITHEYGHGVSNRLVGGPSNVDCLDNSEQMGEGISDYLGLMMTMEPGDQGTDVRGTGNYLFGLGPDGPGIREAPYSTSFAINDYTYGDTRDMSGFSPHSVGFVWATIQWEVTWEMIEAHGFDPDLYNENGTAGNQVMLQLTTEAMKLVPCSPGFVDVRDAVLAADQSLYNGDHIETLWVGFARRGLGLGADQGSSNRLNDNVESFAEPEEVPPAPITDLAAAAASLGIELTWTATGDDGNSGTASSYDVRYSTDGPITTDAQFNAATRATGEPAPRPAGSSERFVMRRLDFDETYHFAIKVSDNSFNTSALSNPASATTLGPPVAQISTAPIQVTTPPGTQTTATFAIGNGGESDLGFAIRLDETTPERRPVLAEVEAAPARATRRAGEVKGAPEPAGTAALRGSGGPDEFGYNWMDSDESGGPDYAWFDVSAIGTPLTLSDDEEVDLALPFPFEYYGVAYNDFRLSSNGALSFTASGDIPYTNETIPNTAAPNAFVCAFWDDLNPGNGGQVDHYHDAANDRFIVQWTDVPRYADSSARMTFQIILNRSGVIEYVYNTMTGDVTSATVGFENQAGDDGLQVVYNAPYVHNQLAVRISSLWVSAEPAAGLVSAGAPEQVTLLFDATGLDEGTYTADMTIVTNDPSNPQVVVPIVFTVGEGSGLVLSLVPEDPPVVVPRGGSVTYTATLTVPEGGPTSLDYWAEATLPNGNVRLVFGPGTVNVTPGTTVSRSLTQAVPSDAPLGAYTYTMNVGDYPGTALASGSFGGTVVAAEVAGGGHEEWALYTADGVLLAAGSVLDLRTGADGAASAVLAGDLPSEPALHAASPNPFGNRTTLRYDVAEAGHVRLAVYDLLGREVAVLADGPTEPGRYAAALDARALASGVYLVRMTEGAFAQTQRITVLE